MVVQQQTDDLGMAGRGGPVEGGVPGTVRDVGRRTAG